MSKLVAPLLCVFAALHLANSKCVDCGICGGYCDTSDPANPHCVCGWDKHLKPKTKRSSCPMCESALKTDMGKKMGYQSRSPLQG